MKASIFVFASALLAAASGVIAQNCGPSYNKQVCAPGKCCSQYGWCDTTDAHCDPANCLQAYSGTGSRCNGTTYTTATTKPSTLSTTPFRTSTYVEQQATELVVRVLEPKVSFTDAVPVTVTVVPRMGNKTKPTIAERAASPDMEIAILIAVSLPRLLLLIRPAPPTEIAVPLLIPSARVAPVVLDRIIVELVRSTAARPIGARLDGVPATDKLRTK
ncbi:hypothetical protein RUND412_010830 [Rhizina undulata]